MQNQIEAASSNRSERLLRFTDYLLSDIDGM